MENKTRTINDNNFNRIVHHYESLSTNYRYLAHSFRSIQSDEILVFILSYLNIDTSHYMAIVDDSKTLAKMFKENRILIPIM